MKHYGNVSLIAVVNYAKNIHINNARHCSLYESKASYFILSLFKEIKVHYACQMIKETKITDSI